MRTTTSAPGEATLAVHNECLYKVVDVATDITTVSAIPAILYGIYVDTVLSNHALPIKDGSNVVLNVVAQAAAGTNLSWPAGIRFETSLVVDPNDAATGGIVVFYKPL